MKLSFYHSVKFTMQCQNPGGSRGFVFDGSIGVHKDVDPLSGMTLNLRDVQEILAGLQALARQKLWPSWQEFFHTLFQAAQKAVTAKGATLTEFRWQEARDFTVRDFGGARSFEWSEIVELDSGLTELRPQCAFAESLIDDFLAGTLTSKRVHSVKDLLRSHPVFWTGLIVKDLRTEERRIFTF